MKSDLSRFLKKTVHNFFEASLNLFLFFPYFFSVGPLFRTLLYPWKNIVTKKEIRGFSFSELLGRIFFNLVSRLIGFVMRLSIILFYILLQTAYVILLPFLVLVFFILLPFMALIHLTEKTDEQKKEELRKTFIQARLLKEENRAAVAAWFEEYYREHLCRRDWWKLSNLFTYPPLARDWAVGYTPILDEFTEDLTSPAYQAGMGVAVGRAREIGQMQEILIKNTEANVLIVGEEGVGKHTIVDALAKRIYEGQTVSLLAYKRILKLNLEKILTRYTDLQQRESFLEDLFAEAAAAKNVILLIENMDKYVAFGPDRIDLSLPIEKFGRGSAIQFIGITTPFFYQRFIFGNDKINRIFTKLDVAEITAEEAKKTLLETSFLFETRSSVIIPYETILDTIDKSEFYITSIPFPEKAFNLLDMACAAYNRAHPQRDAKVLPVILPDLVDTVLSQKTHIPTKLTEEMRRKLVDMEHLIGKRVLNQEEAVAKLAAAMRRSFILLGKRKKPIATFLFLGPTGVGKTETAKALADIFFGSDKYLLRFDMSLYQSRDDIKTLMGSVESGMPGLLTKAVRETPYGVLLLDEIEKADKDLLNIFLTLIDEGYFTDGFGKRVDCKNLIVIGTSNAGADYIFKQETMLGKLSALSEGRKSEDNSDLVSYLVSQRLFSPEFLNRFDGVVTYLPVTESSLLALGRNMISTVADSVYKLYKIRLVVKDSTLSELVKKGYNPAFGARNLQRTMTQEIEDRLAKLILEKKVSEGETVEL